MEILIEHYRLGMKLSLPIIVGGRTILDSGASIDDDRMLDIVKNNGVKKLDVKKNYLKELGEKFPEFYSFKAEQVSSAKESGRLKRVENADFLVKVRGLERTAPAVSIASKIDDMSDIKKVLVPYFKIEVTSEYLGEVASSVRATKLVVVLADSFTSTELDSFKKDIHKANEAILVLMLYRKSPPQGFELSLFCEQGFDHLLPACFMTVFPQHFGQFADYKLTGMCLPALSRELIQLIREETHDLEVSPFAEEMHNFDFYAQYLEGAMPNPEARVIVVRIDNKKGELIPFLKRFHNPTIKAIFISLSHATKEDVVELQKYKNLQVMLGDLSNPKLIDKIKDYTSN